MTPASPAPLPAAPRRDHTWSRPTGDVDDPWAWLADRDDPETTAYLTAENEFAAAWFGQDGRNEQITSIFAEIKSRVQEDDESVPSPDGGWFYLGRTREGASYPIYLRGRSPDTAGRQLVLDVNVEAQGHDYCALGGFEPNNDHTMIAWSRDTTGDERYDLMVRDVGSDPDESPGEYPVDHDLIEATSASGTAWSLDGQHLFYCRPDDQMRPFEVWRHRLGTPTGDDVLVLREEDERFYLGVESTRSGRTILISMGSKNTSEVLVIPAGDPLAEPVAVRPREEGLEYFVDEWGDRFVILTNLDAEDFRVMTAPLDDPATWTELVAHRQSNRIDSIAAFDGHLVLHEWHAAQQRVRILFADGGERTIDLGDEPHSVDLDANNDYVTDLVRFHVQSLTAPATVYDEHVVAGDRTLLKQTPTPNIDLDQYVSERIWATSGDGTEVPIDVVRHVDTAVDGTAPCVVYGYGAYEASMPPWFSVARLSLLDRGFVWALVHPRGGGELGRSWYNNGRLLNKINTFDDTIAAAEHLVATGWSAAGRLCLRGGSAGGLLVGACITKRPDLFASAVAEVPFVDIVTTMSDPTLPLTVTEWEEWGDPRTEPYASYMSSYSPYDRTVPAEYPAIFVTAGINDVRVSYHEPTKWVAKLRTAQTASDRPIVYRCEMGAGHAGPSGRYDAWRDEARVLTFILNTT
ncbi:MAG: S9 family peptidase [Acidimicrobiia bacterium]|nr:S9 family peptidase [Acidimicrobiia bacterium]